MPEEVFKLLHSDSDCYADGLSRLRWAGAPLDACSSTSGVARYVEDPARAARALIGD